MERLIEKAFEGMGQEERLAFIEKLFSELPPAAQQEFLLKLTRQVTGAGAAASGRGEPAPVMPGPPFMRRMMDLGPQGFGPWQMCARMMADIAEAPRVESVRTATPARVFSALADETRLKIIKLLSEGEKSVDELVQALGIAQSTTSHHLRVLKEAGLIKGDKRGRSIYYSLTQPLQES
jgi:DNA-binding HxlR family transcriptional regulator